MRSKKEIMEKGTDIFLKMHEAASKGNHAKFYYLLGALNTIEWVLGARREI